MECNTNIGGAKKSDIFRKSKEAAKLLPLANRKGSCLPLVKGRTQLSSKDYDPDSLKTLEKIEN